ncbi:MAG: hypothetical protein ACOCYT_05185 [Chloroflexota bacterium]
MPVTIERLPDEPIILATVTGAMSVEDARVIFLRSAEIMEQIDGLAFRITDVRAIETEFAEVISMLKSASKGMPGSTSDPRLRVVMVGTHSLTKMFADAMKQQQFGGIAIPVFERLEDALTYVRYEIEKSTGPDRSEHAE